MSGIGNSAPPRRKSCAECIKAKRRCDLQRPICMRCRKQNLACDYGAARQPNLVRQSEESPLASHHVESSASSSTSMRVDADILDPPILSSNIEEILDFPLDVEAFTDMNVVWSDEAKAGLRRHLPVHLAMDTLTCENLPVILEHRLAFAVEQLKLAPKAFAEKCEMPWSHPLLYELEMPPTIREVQASCALYAVKNDTNANSIWRNIEGRAERLFQQETPSDPVELLSYTQAMLTYQIMRMFGGGFTEQARADAAMQQLEHTAYALYQGVDLAGDSSTLLTIYPAHESTTFWRSWIFAESQRRTYLACFMFLSICSILKAQIGYCVEHAALLSVFTASAHLWNARNVFDFTLAWQRKKHFLVREFNFTEVIADAQATDIELFGRILMSGAMGIDNFKGWLYTRGGTL